MPYKHILVATDGSELSALAIRAAVEIAQKFRARLTSLDVVREGVPTAFSGRGLYASKLARGSTGRRSRRPPPRRSP